jgi:hypothetical protein
MSTLGMIRAIVPRISWSSAISRAVDGVRTSSSLFRNSPLRCS